MSDTTIPAIEALRQRVQAFVDAEVIPRENQDLWAHPGRLDEVRRELQALARQAGLYLPHLPRELGGLGLNWRDTAVVLEEAGRSLLGPRSLNGAAPDDGNMRALAHLATPAQRERFLLPLLAGEIRSCFAMTEPAPGAGSDPGLLLTRAERRNGRWVINGQKWFITGADGAGFAIVLARTEGGATMFLVDAANPGMRLGRSIPTVDSFSPGGHSELGFVDCEVGDDAVLGEVHRGFEHAQYRLAPARLTHCMRWLGAAVRATEIAQRYVSQRQSFGRSLAEHQAVQTQIADSHIEVRAARLMIAHTAERLDTLPPTRVKHESSMTKVFVSEVVNRVIDRAVQVCGGWGTTEDSMLAHLYRDARPFRIYDGANEVHRASIAKRVLAKAARP
jgi:acyl-CoA dehydrogenase